MWSKDWSWHIKGSADGPCRGVAGGCTSACLKMPPRNSLQLRFQTWVIWALLPKWFCCWDLGEKAVSQPLNGVAVMMLPSNPSEPKLLNFQLLQGLSAYLKGKYKSFTCFYTGFILSGCTSSIAWLYCSTSPFCCNVNCRSTVTWQKGFWKYQ